MSGIDEGRQDKPGETCFLLHSERWEIQGPYKLSCLCHQSRYETGLGKKSKGLDDEYYYRKHLEPRFGSKALGRRRDCRKISAFMA
jgi:hypothetical protein